MTDFPAKIAIAKCHPFRGDNFYVASLGSDTTATLYILATPAALASSPEVAAIVAESVAKERERCADAMFAYMASKDPDVLVARIAATIADFEDDKHAMAGLLAAAIRAGETG